MKVKSVFRVRPSQDRTSQSQIQLLWSKTRAQIFSTFKISCRCGSLDTTLLCGGSVEFGPVVSKSP
jgi:hypothetical protein